MALQPPLDVSQTPPAPVAPASPSVTQLAGYQNIDHPATAADAIMENGQKQFQDVAMPSRPIQLRGPSVDTIASAAPFKSSGGQPPISQQASQAAPAVASPGAPVDTTPIPGQTESPYVPAGPPVANNGGGIDWGAVAKGGLGLLRGLAEIQSDRYQGLSGNTNPNMTQQRLAREQEMQLQANSLANSLAMQANQYKQQQDMAAINNKYDIQLLQARTPQEKQLIQAQKEAELNNYQQEIQAKIGAVKQIAGGQSVGNILSGTAPNQNTALQYLPAVSP